MDQTQPAISQETSTSTESYDALQARHKRELRDLTARVTALKKTATKGDKKKKKEVLAEAAQLEHALKVQQDKEEKDWRDANGSTANSHANDIPGSDAQDADNGNSGDEDEFDVNDVSRVRPLIKRSTSVQSRHLLPQCLRNSCLSRSQSTT